MFTYFPPVCPATPAAQPQAQGMVSLPGCVYTAQTACCTPAPAQAQFPTIGPICIGITLPVTTQIATAVIGYNGQPQAVAAPQAQFPTLSMTCLQTATHVATAIIGCNNAQAQAAAPAQTFVSLPGCVQTGMTACCAPATAQAQFPTLSMECAQTLTKGLTAALGCNAQAQAQAQFPTLSMECLQTATKVATAVIGCNAQAQAVAPAQTFVSLPGCVQTGMTACCAPATPQAQFPTLSMECAQTLTKGLTAALGCNAQAQAQFPTLSMECLQTATKVATAVIGCNAQAQAVAPAQTLVSLPGCVQTGMTACCTPATAQAQFPTLSMSCLKVTTGVVTAALGCNAQAQAIAPAQLSAYPCPTVAQCAPTWNCAAGSAQAQFPTLSVGCVTIVTTTI